MGLVTLLTDFGTRDEFAGVLKGVILGVNPSAVIIDITHGIAPQDVTGAAYTLKAAFDFFPRQSVHMAVVDPGVGTSRRIVAARCAGHLFLAPDNGLLTPVLSAYKPDAVHAVENDQLYRHPVGRTFHGRDVFAPVAAHLSMGLPLKSLGPPLDPKRLVPLKTAEPQLDQAGVLTGTVVGVDRFGNLITNISVKDLAELPPGEIDIWLENQHIYGLADNYAEGRPGEPGAIIGSRDCLEIFVNGSSAARVLNAARGRKVCVKAER